MPLQSLEFLAFSALVLAAWHLVESRAWRTGLLVVSSAAFVGTWLRDVRQAEVLAATLLGIWAAAWAGQRGLLRGWASPAVAALLLLFLMNKDMVLPGRLGPIEPPEWAAMVGFSLVLLKGIHVVVDASQGQLRPLRPWTFLAYMLAFFVWLAGPIPRYNDFAEQLEEGLLAPPGHQVLPTLNRMANGALKLFVACPFLLPLVQARELAESWGEPWFPLALGLFFFGYYLYIYLNFSGYCDLAIGLGLLLGLRVPENFDRPYLARNLLEYWHRWHATLSEWFRDYLFTPVYLAVAARTGRRAWVLPATVAYLLTFLCTGLWHGLSWSFFLFGMTHGIGCLGLRYLQAVTPRRVRDWQRRSRVALALGCLLTNAWVALSLLFFGHSPGDLRWAVDLALTGWP